MKDEAREKRAFDVFLSHNSKDKPAVRELKQLLVAQGLSVWLDEDELQPGIPWQQLLEAAIKASKAGAVLVGKDGIGPWENVEMRALLSRAVKQGIPVIPVLLPGAAAVSELPPFLGEITYVDLRSGLTDDGLARLIWGITGVKPLPAVTDHVSRSGAPCDRPARAQAGKLFGRDAQLDDLLGRLRRRESTCIWGPAGFGKTALAAEAIHCLLAEAGDDLARSPFPDGIVLLDLYRLSDHGRRPWDRLAEQAWHTLADRLDPTLPADQPARDRAARACAGRQALIVVEGAEEAGDGRHLSDLLSVLDASSMRLVLTRNKAQAAAPHPIRLDDQLDPPDALALLSRLAEGYAPDDVLQAVARTLGGHPLALTWAGCQLALAEEPPATFLKDLQGSGLPAIHEPGDEDHTVKWLYDRSVGRLSDDARRVLAAAGVLAAAPFDVGVAVAVLEDADGPQAEETESRANEALKRLVRHGLLRIVANEERWEFTHALAARFAAAEAVADAALLRALSQWVLDAFRTGADHVRRTEDFSRVQAAALHATALLARDEAGEAADRLANWLLYEGQDLFFALGRLAYARDALNGVETWMRRQTKTRQRTAEWKRARAALLSRLGNVQLSQGDLAGARASYEQSRAIVEKLASGDPSNAEWQRDLSVSLIKLGDVQLSQGDLAGARASYEQSRAIFEKLASGDPSNAGWQRDLGASYCFVGIAQEAQGDLAGAIVSYTACRDIMKKLASGDPSNAEWQRDLSVSLIKLGDVQLSQGDLAGARASYEQSRAIAEKLASGDPSNAGWQRDLSVSLEKLGDVQLSQGDLVGARASYEQSRAIMEKLASGDPTNAEWQYDLGISNERLGTVMQAQGDLDGALDAFRNEFEIISKLASGDPSNAGWQRDLSVSLEKLGDVQLSQGDLVGSRASYEQSRAIAEKLASGDPSNAGWQRDLSVSLEKLGDVQFSQGDLVGSRASYEQSRAIREKLAAGDPSNAEWQRDLSVSLIKLGNVATKSGDPATARREFTDALAITERLTKLDPTNATWRNDAASLRDQLRRLPPA